MLFCGYLLFCIIILLSYLSCNFIQLRLRIGHTRITHSYLLKREEPPYCFGCDTLFTVRHFLLECGDLSHIRNKYYHVDTIKQLFNDVPIDNVFLFLKEINLFKKL